MDKYYEMPKMPKAPNMPKIKYKEITTVVFIILFFTSLTFAQEGIADKQEIKSSGSNSAFTIESGVPVYVIGRGDILEVTLWEGIETKTSTVEVKPNGFVTVSFVELKADGLTVREITEGLQEELKKFIREPRIEVSVKGFRSKNVTLLGAVQSQVRQPTGPGIYPLTGRVTLSQMVTIAGGFARDANLSRIQMTRKNGGVQVINLFALFFKGDLSKDIVLEDGDTIFIPGRVEVEDNIFIFGEVNKPGAYPLKTGITLIQALGLSGGYKDSAFLKDIRVIRGSLNNPDLIAADVDAIIKKGALENDMVLEKNDIIYVPKNKIGNWNAFLARIRPTLEFIVLPFAGARVIEDVIEGN